MRLALCDDEKSQLAQTEALLQRYQAQRLQTDWTVTTFSSSSALLEHICVRGTFDLYLLDVIMPGENGIELGLQIRKLDQGGRIVYLTASPDFAVDSYQAKASGYLLKPVEQARLFPLLDDLTESWQRERQSFITIKTRDGIQRLPIHTIVYGELVKRCVHYHLADGSRVEGMSLRGAFQTAVKPLLEHRRFVLCATSFLVNLSFVEMIDASGLRLVGGKTLPLSRSLRTDVTNQWMDYYLSGGQ